MGPIQTYTPYQAKYFAHFVTREALGGDGVTQSLSAARVDLNPHQVDAAMFAMRSPLSKGVLLADEVGLGKTIEAALVISQRWWEGRRHLLLITPASLRKQWAQELWEKFSLPSIILDAKRVRALQKQGQDRPLQRTDGVIITSYEYAARIAVDLRAIRWDLVVFDEAHKLRNVYRAKENARATVLRSALADRQKLLLTATPLQNNLMELYGLLSVIDEQFFGSADAFRAEFGGREDRAALSILGRRLEPICKRTLRRQVQKAGLINYTNRHPRTFDFTPSRLEADLYCENVGLPPAREHDRRWQGRASPRDASSPKDSRFLVLRGGLNPRQDAHPPGTQAQSYVGDTFTSFRSIFSRASIWPRARLSEVSYPANCSASRRGSGQDVSAFPHADLAANDAGCALRQ